MNQVVTVFRNRLRAESHAGYVDTAARMDELARTMPGHVDSKTFVADDGERVTIVTFADRATHEGWRDHPEHRAAQQKGITDFYETYSIQVADVTYQNVFTQQ
ncbi:MAG: antibiotic biosynthesis monooxygenase family protein [Actinomycetota bacterium]